MPLLDNDPPVTVSTTPGVSPADAVPADGSNRVPYARMESSTKGWAVVWDPQTLGPTVSVGAEASSGRRWAKASVSFTATDQVIEFGQSTAFGFKVTPGERLSVQVRLEATGAYGWVVPGLNYFDKDGVYLGTTELDGFWEASTFDTNRQAFVEVPALAQNAILTVVFYSSGAGAASIAIAEPMITTAHATQTVHPPFAQGPYADPGATVGGQFGRDILRPNGDPATDADYHTPSGTAAAIVGQSSWATYATKTPTQINSDITSAGQTAVWGSVSSRPTELTDGRVSAGLTSTGDLNRNISSTRANSSNLLRYTSGGLFTGELAADVTATHTAAAITGQGSLATKSAVNFGSSEVTNRTAGNLTYSGGATVESLKPAEAGATLGGVFGTNLRETAGGTVATLANFKTSSGTAAAITGQGALATLSRATRMTKSAPSADVTLNALATDVTPQEMFNFTHTGGGGEAILQVSFDLTGATTCDTWLYVYLDGTFVWLYNADTGVTSPADYEDAPRYCKGQLSFSFMFDLGTLSSGTRTIRVYAAKSSGAGTSTVKNRRAVCLESII